MSESSATESEILSISETAQQRISALLSSEDAQFFRVAVNGGGCSGFQYDFGVAEEKKDDDHLIACGSYHVLVDDVSVAFLKGAVLDYVIELIGASFVIKNPNAKSSCGCGVSFSV
ncbi:MAG: iron-sulfur cluster assembly accessory protein [Pseudomonadota bacterium]